MKQTMMMIGNAHLDPVWLWRWQEGFAENKATLKSALDRLDEFPEAVFTSSSAQFYEWVEHNAPDLFERIGARIREGRWVICGGWWVQPDCNIPCGESFARHTLLGQNYFYEKFGVLSRTGYNVDSFGHNGMLPQILRLSRMDRYVFMRPAPEEKALPGRTFLWESQDGSRVTAHQIAFTYGTFGDQKEHMARCAAEIAAPCESVMCFYGVGNHGGGPTVQNIRDVLESRQGYRDKGIELCFASPDRFFDEAAAVNDRLPVVREDLQHHSSGCYSVHSEVKRLNRRAENKLLAAEKYSVLANALCAAPYPDSLTHAWKGVLFNQFHDILAGTAIEAAYDDARHSYGEAITIAERAENSALQRVSFGVNIPFEQDMVPVVVFNPHAWEVNLPVEVETGMFLNSRFAQTIRVLDWQGNPVDWQDVDTHAKAENRRRIVFLARIAPMGYGLFRICRAEEEDQAQEQAPAQEQEQAPAQEQEQAPALKSGGITLENGTTRLTIDPETGTISELTDKQSGKTLICVHGGCCAAVLEDDSDTWSHGVETFDSVIGRFEPVSVKKIEDGRVRSAVRVISRYNQSTMVQTYTLYHDRPEVTVKARVNWQEQWKALKLHFPVQTGQAAAPRVTYEIPFGTIEKPADGKEEAFQNWFDCSDAGGAGLAILNDGKYSGSADKNRMGLMVLRSPVYAHHQPKQLDGAAEEYSFIDQGIQEFTYALCPHGGAADFAGIVRMGWELNQPLSAVVETYHDGALPVWGAGLAVGADNVVVSSLKRCERGDEIALRLYETAGIAVDTTVSAAFCGREFRVCLNPHEIKTVRIPRDPEQNIAEIDLLEWEIEADRFPGCSK